MSRKKCIFEIVIDTVIAIFIICTILSVICCLVLAPGVSVGFVHIF